MPRVGFAGLPGTRRTWALLALLVLLVVTLVQPPGARAASQGQVHVAKRGADGAVWIKTWQGGWSDWTSLGGGIRDEPAITSWGPDRADVLARGNDDALWHRAFYDGHWHGWERLGGVLNAAPAAVSWAAGRLDVFVRGSDNSLYQLAWTGDRWRGWYGFGGALTSAPTVASWGPGRLDVFARDSTMALTQITFDDGRWSGWVRRGGLLGSAPAAVSSTSGRIDVFVRGAGGELATIGYLDSHWTVWYDLGGQIASAPGVSSWGPGSLDVFARGTDDRLWQRSYAHGWRDWQGVPDGQRLVSGLSAVATSITTSDVRKVVSKGVTYWITIPPGKRGVAVNTALDQLGDAYRSGGTGPHEFDCSGLVVYSYQAAGVTMPSRTASGMYSALPKTSNPQRGDLVYFGSPVHHVAIYLGDDLMVTAPKAGDVVKIANIRTFGSPPKFTTVPA